MADARQFGTGDDGNDDDDAENEVKSAHDWLSSVLFFFFILIRWRRRAVIWMNAASSVTRYWSKNVAQVFTKVAQIDATAVFT